MTTFILLTCILPAFTVSLGDWHHPHYSFRCLENGDVDLYGLHNGSTVYLENSECNNSLSANGKTPVPIMLHCLNKTKSAENMSITTINIIVYDPIFDTTTKETSPEPDIIGGIGAHIFTIVCNEIPKDGVNKTVAHVFQGTDSHQLPKNYKEVDGVEMRFKAADNPDAPDISSIYVGDEFYMFLKYMGETNYILVPRKCEAIEGTMVPKNHNVDHVNHVDLWKYNSPNTCASHRELLVDFTRVHSSTVVAQMYGFRFSGNNYYVTITCDVTMYPPEKNKNDTCLAPPQRRKRSIELKTHQVSKTMQIFDSKNSYQSENRSQCNHCGISVWIVALITTTLYRQL
ncbi:uncharacterized protein LOC125681623 [Ostrea edulis]|uniref:uncharacterized protein LOC125681623 n=1 Tax=Ostrea edulis TaxID=37623 RepID=UPI0024AE8B7D|nr:uncharacterized protein LOC125681623 [Ostrea edulis]XP_056009608.1 uncharacterized protein LOC125681623 [Ostrea edulis]